MLLGIAHLRPALEQAWPPFVLVAALLALGRLAGEDGLFDAAASRLERLPGGAVTCLLACLGLVALVTALLNLDTAAVFLTPVLIGVARRRALDTAPFLYGTIFMVNASSLFLPGSNLTNLLVLSGRHVDGGTFLARMAPVACAAAVATAAGVVVMHRRALRGGHPGAAGDTSPLHVGAGLLGAAVAAVLILALRNPALPVLALATCLLLWRAARGRAELRRALASLGLPSLLGLFALSVALGVAARSGLDLSALRRAGGAATASAAALASVLVNNLPAAVLLSAGGRLSTRALLIGLNLGPNLAVTGSLSVLLWWRAARAAGERPSALAYSRQGLVLAPLAIGTALLVSAV